MIGAVDCTDHANGELCNTHVQGGYPTLLHFKYGVVQGPYEV